MVKKTMSSFKTHFQKFEITNINTTYTGITSDEYIRCSGTTSGSTYTLFLPLTTGSGNLFTIKNVSTGVITILAQGNQTIDYSSSPIVLNQYDVLRLIDADPENWDKI